jgi:hypothetical protein
LGRFGTNEDNIDPQENKKKNGRDKENGLDFQRGFPFKRIFSTIPITNYRGKVTPTQSNI